MSIDLRNLDKYVQTKEEELQFLNGVRRLIRENHSLSTELQTLRSFAAVATVKCTECGKEVNGYEAAAKIPSRCFYCSKDNLVIRGTFDPTKGKKFMCMDCLNQLSKQEGFKYLLSE